MFSHYQHISSTFALSFKDFDTMDGHDFVNALHRQAFKLAPRFEEETADAGCTNLRPGDDQPRRQRVWDMLAEALTWNLLADHPALVSQAKDLMAQGTAFTVEYHYGWEINEPEGRTVIVVDDTPQTVTVKVTHTQAYLLDDMDVAGSESYHEAVAAGLVLDTRKGTLTIPPAAAQPFGLAIGIRADIADEGNYSIGERRSWLSLAAKVAAATKNPTALPLYTTPPAAYDVVDPEDVEVPQVAPAAPVSPQVVCKHCGGYIERQPGVGWVLTEIGGTYDSCDGIWNTRIDSPGRHQPYSIHDAVLPPAPTAWFRVYRYFGDTGTWHLAPGTTVMSETDAHAWIAAQPVGEFKLIRQTGDHA